MAGFNMTQDFRVGLSALRRPRALAILAPARLAAAKLKTLAAGAVAGWGAAILVGAVMMAHVSRQATPTPALPPAVAAVAAPQAAPPAPAPRKPDPIAAAVATPVAAPTPVAKTTQRIDMTPTAAIPADPSTKAKHRRKKKAKPLDGDT